MKKAVFALSALTSVLTLGFFAAYRAAGSPVFLTLCISFGTVAYHFLMRLSVGALFNAIMKNRADCGKRWFGLREWEKKLYDMLRVKRWKSALPTFAPELFDLTRRSPAEVAQATCQAELVHETCAVLSLAPMLLIIPFGEPAVFVITSLVCMLAELAFIAVQRYNRPRILRLAERTFRHARDNRADDPAQSM